MLAAIVILNYNCKDDTIRLVETVKGYSQLTLIVVVDNMSPDNSFEELKALADERVHVIQTDRNGGYGYGNNVGIMYAKRTVNPDIVIISNPDVYFSRETLENMLLAFSRCEGLAACAPLMLRPHNDDITLTAWQLPTVISEAALCGIISFILLHETRLSHYYPKSHYEKGGYCPVDCITGSLVAFHTDRFINSGMYDAEFFLYSEESVVGHRLKEWGYKSVILGGESYMHYEGGATVKAGMGIIKRQRMYHKSKLMYLKKYRSIGKCAEIFLRSVFLLSLIEYGAYILFRRTMDGIKGR